MSSSTPFLCHLCVWTLLIFSSCTSGDKKQEADTLFTLMENTGVDFSNDIHNTKDFNIFTYRNFYNGGGVAIGDINNDGLSDLFFTSNMGSNRLYLNKGGFAFEDITEKAGILNKGKWGTGVVFVDINSDGLLDIYVCYAGYQQGKDQRKELYINQGSGRFVESAAQYGLDDNGYTTHAAFFDYDLDGDLDCYILNNSFIPVNTLNYANKRDLRAEDWPVADFLKGGGDKLLRNDKGHFVDVSKEANIFGSLIGFGLGVTVGDVNGDHYPDIYVSNDFFERDYLYINAGNGTFREELEQWMQHISHSSMGADFGDVNNDGYPDIFTTDMLPDDDYRLKTTTTFETIDVNRYKVQSGFYRQFTQNTLQVNNRSGKFMETGYYSGVAASDWSWGGLIFDADNDGLSDLFVCNGIYHDVTDQDFIDFFANDVIQRMVLTGKKDQVDEIIKKMPSRPIPNKAFRNTGNLRFSDQAAAWGLDQPSFSNGAAYGDLDNDGDLDLVVNNVNAKAFVYRNNTRAKNKNHFIGIKLQGKAPNLFAVGSTVKLFAGEDILSREVIPSRGFQSSVDYKTIIGLGGRKNVDSLQVIWPDRTVTTLKGLAVDSVYTLQQSAAAPFTLPSGNGATLFDTVSHQLERHAEDDYTDFYSERGVPELLSREGPKASVGDVNNDGQADLFIGGAAGQGSRLYLQQGGRFYLSEQPDWKSFKEFEDVASAFFDADGDGDLDLVVGSGGNAVPAFSTQYLNRLFLNDGKGHFTLAGNALPPNGMNISVLAPEDVDGDGDLDLFIGSRSYPQSYGLVPPSYLLLNDGKGRFTDATKTLAPVLQTAGMVTAAVWTDLTGDAKKELVLTGEWMAPLVINFAGGKATVLQTNLSGQHGWWQSVQAADLDGDGDQDLVLGNIGKNFYLHPEPDQPVKLWMSDFDKNGSVEKIITHTREGKDKPVFLKRELVEQIASLRKQNLKYDAYARKSIQELFSEEALKGASVRLFNHAGSVIAYNEGGGQFRIEELPLPVQWSSVNAILCTDLNGDGRTDLVLGGNKFGFLPQFSQIDASYGHVLLNTGNGKFQLLAPAQTGISVRGETRDIVQWESGGQKNLLFLQNDDRPVWYRLKPSAFPSSLKK